MFIGLVTADVDILVFAIKVVDKCVLSMKEDWRKNYFKPKKQLITLPARLFSFFAIYSRCQWWLDLNP